MIRHEPLKWPLTSVLTKEKRDQVEAEFQRLRALEPIKVAVALLWLTELIVNRPDGQHEDDAAFFAVALYRGVNLMRAKAEKENGSQTQTQERAAE